MSVVLSSPHIVLLQFDLRQMLTTPVRFKLIFNRNDNSDDIVDRVLRCSGCSATCDV